MSGYSGSGSPAFPAEGPYPRDPQEPQAAEWPDAEATALLPPVPPQGPSGQDEVAPPSTSRFGQIHEKYATADTPLWSQGQSWTDPLDGPLPQQAGQQLPQAVQAPAWAGDQPQQQASAQGWTDALDGPLPPVPQQGSGWTGQQSQQAPAQPGWQPQSAQPEGPWQQQPPTGAPAPAPGGPGSSVGQQAPAATRHAADSSFEPAQSQAWQPPATAPHGAYVDPSGPYAVPPQPGYAPAPGGFHPAAPPAPQYPPSVLDSGFVPPLPPYPAPGGAPAPGQPSAGPGGPAAAPGSGLAPEPTGWSDAPVAYAAPASLRETFAAAQPTGPAGVLAPQPPPALDAQVGDGSLRQAFAAAQPTGPEPAPPAFAPTATSASGPGTAAAGPVRTGSPIIDPGIQPAAATAGIAVLLALAALAGRPALVVPTLLLQAVTSAGWFRLNGMWPARQGIALAALGGFTADAAMLAVSGGTAPAVLAGTLGGFFLLVLILQIFRPSNPDERFYALTVSASATVMTVLAGSFLAAGTLTHHGWSTGAAVAVGTVSAAAAVLVSALPFLPAKAGFGAGAVAASAAGLALGAVTGPGAVGGLLLGLAAGAGALIGRRVAAYDFPSRFVHLTAGVALPLACAAPAVYLVGQLLAG